MAREFIVEGLRAAAASEGVVVGANIMGKIKAFLQTACICLGLGVRAFDVAPSPAAAWVTALTGPTLALAWIFAAIFVWQNRSLLRQAG
jgi:phosphatidylglycerophosphate synthase